MRLVAFLLATVFLVSCGGTAFRSAIPAEGTVPLVTFVFDDGNDTDYLVGRDIFAKAAAVACSAITTDWVNTAGHMTADQIVALQKDGWEIMAHTASHPNLRALTQSELRDEFSRSNAVLEGLGLAVTNIVYPFNKENGTVRAVARNYYRSGRGGTNSFNKGAVEPYHLNSFAVKHDADRLRKLVDHAYANKYWLILYQHEIDAKVKISGLHRFFINGETVTLTPSKAVARFVALHWLPVYGHSAYIVPLSGDPQPGDTLLGAESGATARIDHVIYNDAKQLRELLGHIRFNYPDLRIVTINQGLDALGAARGQVGPVAGTD